MDRITLLYDASPVRQGKGTKVVDDQTRSAHFGPAEMQKLREGDTIEIERTLRPENPEYPGRSYNIKHWKLFGAQTRANQLFDGQSKQEQPRPPSYRQQTHPVDAKQMWINGLLQQWMAAYAQLLSVTTDGKMKEVNANVVEQAARAIASVADRMFGPTMTQTGNKMTKAASEEEMNDEIGF